MATPGRRESGGEGAGAATPLAADAAIEALARAGVTHVFGLPGTTIMHLLDALGRRRDLRTIVTRHEQVAGFMADGFARGSRALGVCLASRGPGAANLAIALDNAASESVPVLALVGQVEDELAHRHAFEELDLVSFLAPLTKWAFEVHDPARVPELVQRAAEVALAGRPRPVLASLPLDVLTSPLPDPRWRPVTRVAPPAPAAAEVEAAAALLADAARPLLVLGGGAERARAAEAARELAERLDAPVAVAWHRKGAFPDSHPAFVGGLGFGALPVTERAVREADVVLALGCRFSQFTSRRWTLLAPETALIQVDVDPEELGRSYAPAVAVWGDARTTAHALAAVLTGLPLDRAEERAAWRRALRERYERESTVPVAPDATKSGVGSAALVAALRRVHELHDPIVVQDAPTFGAWVQRYLRVERPGSYFGNAGGAMGWGFAAALGIQLARPDERVLAIVGDGSFWMVAQDLETAVRERIPVVTVVPNNFAYGNTRDRQLADHEGRTFGVFYDNPDFAAFARLLGAHGERVERPDELGPALERALASGLPAVVDVIQDRYEGLPPDVRPPAAAATR